MVVSLRSATIDDADFLLTCRNDIKTREASHNTNVVEREKHINWLKNTINDSTRSLYVAEENDVLVGTARADYLNDMYELSWTVAPDARGRGIGKKIVKSLSDKVNGTICAEIKNSNIQSISIAKSIGMELLKESDGILYFIKY